MVLAFEEYKRKYPDQLFAEFTEGDYIKMVECNPFPYNLFGKNLHLRFNNFYLCGWIDGFYAALTGVLNEAKRDKEDWNLTHEKFRKIFAAVTNTDNFGLKKEEDGNN